jgi:tRNA-2-methylthio-N6-dimethylallyladenosine synthase
MNRRVFIETYGCQMNVSDSELMLGVLSEAGFSTANSPEEADVVLLNTCAIREKAEERIFGRLSSLHLLKQRRPEVLFGVAGCMAEHLKASLQERAPFVDLVIGPDAYRRLPQLIEQAQFDPTIDVRLDRGEVYEGIDPLRADGVSGWITIQRGCDKFCAFCIVPYVRGRERGVSPREVLRQARMMAEQGVSCVTLLGQTVNSYRYEDADFADLLRAVAQVDGIEQVRFTSPYPIDFTPKLIELIATEPKVCKAVHLPLQSGSDRVLAAMRRQHDWAFYAQLVEDLRGAIPDLSLTTDIIVGFPGEEEEDFEATRRALAEVKFDSAFMFAYSEREGTAASKKLPDTVSEAEKKRRLTVIIDQQQEISRLRYVRHVGKRLMVLVEGNTRRNPADLIGKTDDFKTAIFPSQGRYRAGDFVEVEVTSATSHTLLGQPVRLVSPSRLPLNVLDQAARQGMSEGAAPLSYL